MHTYVEGWHVRIFSDLLAGVTVSARSPDGKITGEIEDGRNVIMGFTSGTYRRYSESELAHQVAGLIASLWTGQRRARLAILAERSSCEVRDGSRIDLRSREFTDARNRLQAEGRSKSGRIILRINGTAGWQANIKPDTVRQLHEEEFLGDLWTAFLATLEDRRSKLEDARREVFELSSRTLQR